MCSSVWFSHHFTTFSQIPSFSPRIVDYLQLDQCLLLEFGQPTKPRSSAVVYPNPRLEIIDGSTVSVDKAASLFC